METSLTVIARHETENEAENHAFRTHLEKRNGAVLDITVMRLDGEISAAIDCTQCGNCCRSLMINVTAAECESTSSFLNMKVADFKLQYIETSPGGTMVMNRMPCHFLSGNSCTVYEQRFTGCREFPHLHLPGFQQRIFGLLMHYGRCPIIYNVMEALKLETGFKEAV